MECRLVSICAYFYHLCFRRELMRQDRKLGFISDMDRKKLHILDSVCAISDDFVANVCVVGKYSIWTIYFFYQLSSQNRGKNRNRQDYLVSYESTSRSALRMFSLITSWIRFFSILLSNQAMISRYKKGLRS